MDTLYELIAAGVFHDPRFAFAFRSETLTRPSHLKAALCQKVFLDCATLLRNEYLIAWRKGRKALGDRIHLFTATTKSAACRLAEAVPLFDDLSSPRVARTSRASEGGRSSGPASLPFRLYLGHPRRPRCLAYPG